ncbi:MAG: helix-turn-helix domain-containing protein [Armatimonadota bacterium]
MNQNENECQMLRVEEVARIIGRGKTSTYAAINRGEIPSVKIGGMRMVPKPALERMLSDASGINMEVK